MLNKFIFIIGLISLLYTTKTFSQAITFGYDENGNRTSRTIYLGLPNKISQNTDTVNVTDTVSYAYTDTTNFKRNQVETIIENNKITIYPNPVKSYLVVDINEITDSKAEIIIADEFGKTLDKIMVRDNSNKIEFSQRARGIYFIKISINGKSESWKIIKE